MTESDRAMNLAARHRPPRSVIVVGASAGGLTTVEALRRQGFDGSITLIGDEDHLPYDRPPLSKQVLSGAWPEHRIRLRESDQLAGLGVELITGDPAVELDVEQRSVTTASGRTHRAEAIVTATGLRARRLAGPSAPAGVHYLRKLEDASELRAALLPGSRLLIVGDGVLGAEIAATAARLDVRVTIVGPRASLMQRQLGSTMGQALTDLHAEQGVDLRLGRTVERMLELDGHVRGAALDNGDTVTGDRVIVAIGGTPATGWLASSGLGVSDGVECDSRCRAADNVYAVGDVARWHHERLGRSIRLENRTNAGEQAIMVARNILGADLPYVPVPYFWTDQYDAKIQVHGFVPEQAETEIIEGSLADRRCVGRVLLDGRSVGVIGWNMPKQTRVQRRGLIESVVTAS